MPGDLAFFKLKVKNMTYLPIVNSLFDYLSLKNLFGFLMLLTGGVINIANADVPYIFTPNTPAKADEVNENFRVLDDAIKNIKLIPGPQGPAGPQGAPGGSSDSPDQVREKFFSGTLCKGATPDDIMVKVGPICVDKYEASVWSNPDGTGAQYGIKAAAEYTDSVTGQLVRPADDYPCKDNGNDCSASAAHPIYAISKKGVVPSRYATWFQAQQACANSGKRLLTNAEWQMAAAGTPDPTQISQSDFENNLATLEQAARSNPGGAGDDGLTTCSTVTSLGASVLGTAAFSRGAFLPVLTGSRNNCVSVWDVNDMVGNVWEWVADWMQGSPDPATPTNSTSNESYAHDFMANVSPAPSQGTGFNMPAAIYRGANGRDWIRSGVFAFAAARSPADSADDIGFRCAK